MNRDDRTETDSSLERSCPGACPGGLIQVSDPHRLRIPTPVDPDHLEIDDELEPPVEFVGDWIPLVGDHPSDATITAEGDQLFVLDFYPRAGIAHRQKCRTRHLTHNVSDEQATPNFIHNILDPDEDVGRGDRARADFYKLARSNELNLFVTLTYEDQLDDSHRYPSACDDMFTLYVRRVRKKLGSFPWLEVLEYGADNYRLHHHVLFPATVDPEVVSEKWTYGHVVLITLPDIDAIGKTAGYMSEHFTDSEQMRPRRNRYRTGRLLYREKPVRIIGTLDEIEKRLRGLLPEGINFQQWLSQHPYSSGGYSWNREIVRYQ